MKIPTMLDFISYPPEPVCLPADTTYALINDPVPLELHGSVDAGEALAPLCIGAVYARRSDGGKVVFTTAFRSPAHEQLFNEIAKYSPMSFGVKGGSWPYKAMVGIEKWAKNELEPLTRIPRFSSLTLQAAHVEEYERDDFTKLEFFVIREKKKAGNCAVSHYSRSGKVGVSGAFGAIIQIAASDLPTLDRLHLRLIQKETPFRLSTEHLGKVKWDRCNRECLLNINITGTLGFIADFCSALASK